MDHFVSRSILLCSFYTRFPVCVPSREFQAFSLSFFLSISFLPVIIARGGVSHFALGWDKSLVYIDTCVQPYQDPSCDNGHEFRKMRLLRRRIFHGSFEPCSFFYPFFFFVFYLFIYLFNKMSFVVWEKRGREKVHWHFLGQYSVGNGEGVASIFIINLVDHYYG